MKVIHIEARLKSEVILPQKVLDSLPEKLIVFTTIQLMKSLPGIIKQLEDTGKKPFIVRTNHTRHDGQILGCNVEESIDYTTKEFDAFLYVGDGLFHPKSLSWKNSNKKVFAYDPFTDKFSEIQGEDIELIKKKHKAAISKFLMSTKIGVLITIKPGQYMMKKALKLKEQYPEKEFYFFLDNTYNFQSLEDFPFVDIWVNTACPRIGFDDSIRLEKAIINVDDVLKK
ncbi:MAG: diphthamide synthesis protein [Candidatus Woesearchaeota archaeon]|jgi:2-(3-amino-3-carboxypropyl)histidine synthase